jgi:hypothetical protein
MSGSPLRREGGRPTEGPCTPFQDAERRRFNPRYSLVIWEWVPAHATLENRGRVRVFCHRTEVEHPVVLPMASIQKPLRIFAFVSIKAFHAGRRVAHNDHPIRDVYEIFDVNPSGIPFILSSTLAVL